LLFIYSNKILGGKMTDKFQSYVDNIQEKNKFKLLLIPTLVVIFIIVLNQLLIIPLILIFNDSLKEILSFTGTSNLVDEAFCVFLSIFLMTKISKLTSKIREISTEIFRYDIYPF